MGEEDLAQRGSRMDEDEDGETLESVKKLIDERDQIDRKISEQHAILKANNADMSTKLVDDEGFPVSNVDVYSVRHARHAIICAQNDRKQLTDRIEAAMLKLHEKRRSQEHLDNGNGASENGMLVHRTSNNPIAVIDRVLESSPAYEAGLKNGDEIIQLAQLHSGNMTDLNELTTAVQASIGKEIRITVARDGRPKRLVLTPRNWSGRGVLGCAVLPVSTAKFV